MLVDNFGQSIKNYSNQEKKDNGIEGIFISPSNPAVRRFLRSVVREIVDNYDVDGIHLDYVRYPSYKFSYDNVTRARFEKEFRIDPLALINGYGDWNDEQYYKLLVQWKDWRAEQVSKLVRGIFYDLQKRNRNIKLSAAVIANLDFARTKFGQRWDEWLREGIIDFVVPMAYSTDTDKVIGYLKDALENKYERYIYAGLGIYNQDSKSSIEKIYNARKLGVDGIVLFSYDGVKDDPLYFYALKEGPLQDSAIPPEMPWKKEQPKKFEEEFPMKIGLPKWTINY